MIVSRTLKSQMGTNVSTSQLLVITVLGIYESQSAHILHVGNIMLYRHTELSKEAVKEIEHIEAGCRMLTLFVKHEVLTNLACVVLFAEIAFTCWGCVIHIFLLLRHVHTELDVAELGYGICVRHINRRWADREIAVVAISTTRKRCRVRSAFIIFHHLIALKRFAILNRDVWIVVKPLLYLILIRHLRNFQEYTALI